MPQTTAEGLRNIAQDLPPDHAELVRLAADELEGLAGLVAQLPERTRQAAVRLRDGVAPLGAFSRTVDRLTVGGAVAPPPPAEPDLCRFVLSWTYQQGEPPAPGSFVYFGELRAPWRVHAFERLVIGGRLATLEAVDAHDVPVLADVRELPRPHAEILEGELEDWQTLDGEATSVLLCGSTYVPAPDTPEVPCGRFHEHPGEHLGTDADGHEFVWEGGVEWPSRSVPADSAEADFARMREGVAPWAKTA